MPITIYQIPRPVGYALHAEKHFFPNLHKDFLANYIYIQISFEVQYFFRSCQDTGTIHCSHYMLVHIGIL